MGQNREIQMCRGSLWKNIWLFSVPLMFSNVLQILFNLSDIAVVGRFAGTIALGSVGSTTILITLTTGIMLGIGSGVNAVAALYAGARQDDKLKKTVHTSALICLLTGICLMLAGLFFSRPILVLIRTKEELLSGADIYLKIYLMGSPALAIYNYGNGVLSAVGETRKPLKYLTIAGIINVILNLIFVIGLRLNVVGVALASIISQYISAFLILRSLWCTQEIYGFRFRRWSELQIDGNAARQVLYIGVPTALQYVLFSVANLYVQSAVNYFDHVVVEGNSAAVNADGLVYDVMAAFYVACTTFISQNRGAGNKDRILKVYGITMLYSFAVSAAMSACLLLFTGQFLSLFTTDPQVISYGTVRLHIMGLSYAFSAFMDNAAAGARGLGKSVIPTVIVITGSVIFRIGWICTVFAYFHTLTSLYSLYICSWLLSAAAGNIYFFWCYRKLRV